MKQEHLDYLTNNDYNPDMFVIFNRQLTAMARKKDDHEMYVIDIDHPDDVVIVGAGFSIAQKKWAESNGLMGVYESFMGGSTETTVTQPEKTFNEKVDSLAHDVNQNGNENLPPPPPAEENPLLENFGSYAQRHDYLTKELGFIMDPDVGGYVNDIKDRMVPAAQTRQIADAEEFHTFLKKRLETHYDYPTKEESVEDVEVVEEVVESEPEPVEEEPKPEIKKVSLEERIKMMEDAGFPYADKKKKNFLMGGGLGMSLEALGSIMPTDWEETFNGWKEKFSDFLNEQKSNSLDSRKKALAELGWIYDAKKNVYTIEDSPLTLSGTEVEKITNETWDEYLKSAKRKADNVREQEEKRQKQLEKIKSDEEAKEQEGEESEEPEKIQMLDKKGEVVAETTVELESQDEDEPSGTVILDVPGSKAEHIKKKLRKIMAESAKQEMVFKKTSHGFFSKFLSYKFHSVSLTFTRIDDERFALAIKPSTKLEDKALLEIQPMQLKGTAEDFDNNFFDEIDKPLAATSKLFEHSDQYLSELKKAEKKAKVTKEKEEKLKKAIDDLEKYIKGDKQTKVTMTKRIEAVLDLDPHNKLALEKQEELKQGTLL